MKRFLAMLLTIMMVISSFPAATFAEVIDDNIEDLPAVTLKETPVVSEEPPTLASGKTWLTKGGAFGNGSIKKLYIVDSVEDAAEYLPEGKQWTKSWDGSDDGNGGVTVFWQETDKIIIIAGNGAGRIYANPDSSYAFGVEMGYSWYQVDGPFRQVIDIGGFELLDTSKVTTMEGMFSSFGGYGLLKVPDVSGWDTSNVTNMKMLFGAYVGDAYWTLNPDEFNVVPDVSRWNTSKVETLEGMFYIYASACKNMTVVPDVATKTVVKSDGTTYTAWDTSNVKNLAWMFAAYGDYCKNLNLVPDVSGWDTGEVTTMNHMFHDFASGQSNSSIAVMPDVSNWNVSKCDDFSDMFSQFAHNTSNANLEADLSGWEVKEGASVTSMFDNLAGNKTSNEVVIIAPPVIASGASIPSNTTKVSTEDYVAMIGTTGYETLAAAVLTAKGTEAVISLANDCEENLTLAAEESFRLHIGSHDFSGTVSTTAKDYSVVSNTANGITTYSCLRKGIEANPWLIGKNGDQTGTDDVYAWVTVDEETENSVQRFWTPDDPNWYVLHVAAKPGGTGTMMDFTSTHLSDEDGRPSTPWFDQSAKEYASAHFGYSIDAIVVEDGILNIGDFAFYHLMNVERLDLGNTVETLGKWSCGCLGRDDGANFSPNPKVALNAKVLKEIYIPDSVKTIKDEAFSTTDRAVTVSMPGTVESIGKGLFQYSAYGPGIYEADTAVRNVIIRGESVSDNLAAVFSVFYRGGRNSVFSPGIENIYVDSAAAAQKIAAAYQGVAGTVFRVYAMNGGTTQWRYGYQNTGLTTRFIVNAPEGKVLNNWYSNAACTAIAEETAAVQYAKWMDSADAKACYTVEKKGLGGGKYNGYDPAAWTYAYDAIVSYNYASIAEGVAAGYGTTEKPLTLVKDAAYTLPSTTASVTLKLNGNKASIGSCDINYSAKATNNQDGTVTYTLEKLGAVGNPWLIGKNGDQTGTDDVYAWITPLENGVINSNNGTHVHESYVLHVAAKSGGTGRMMDFEMLNHDSSWPDDGVSSAPWFCGNTNWNTWTTTYYIEQVVVEPGVKNIGDYAFYRMLNVTSLDLGTIEELGAWSCAAMGRDDDGTGWRGVPDKILSTVVIPDTCKIIGEFAFTACDRIMTITIPGDLDFIGKGAFEYPYGYQMTIDNVYIKGDTISSAFLESLEKVCGNNGANGSAFHNIKSIFTDNATVANAVKAAHDKAKDPGGYFLYDMNGGSLNYVYGRTTAGGTLSTRFMVVAPEGKSLVNWYTSDNYGTVAALGATVQFAKWMDTSDVKVNFVSEQKNIPAELNTDNDPASWDYTYDAIVSYNYASIAEGVADGYGTAAKPLTLLSDSEYAFPVTANGGDTLSLKLSGKNANVTTLKEDSRVTPGEPDADGVTTYTLSMINYVARIGTDRYESLADAIAAVTDSTETTITMIADEEVIGKTGVIIPKNRNIILDLDGRTISADFDNAGACALITNNGTLTIKDSTGGGKIVSGAKVPGMWTAKNYATNVITNYGTLNIESGHLENTGNPSNISYVIDNNSSLGDAVLTISGGKLVNPYCDVVRMFCNSTTRDNNVTVTGGELISDNGAAVWLQLPGNNYQKRANLTISDNAKLESTDGYAIDLSTWGDTFEKVVLTINGGEVKGGIDMLRYNNNTEKAYALTGISITGGKISKVDSTKIIAADKFITAGYFDEDVTEYVADGYKCIPDTTYADYGYIVVPCDFVAENIQTGKQYETIQAALSEASSNDTIKLLKNVDLGDFGNWGITVAAGKNVTLDLAGKTLSGGTSNGATSALLLNKGTLTLKDSSEEHTGRMYVASDPNWVWGGIEGVYDGSYASNLIRNEGTLTIESGTYENGTEGSASYAVDTYAGSVTVTGGILRTVKSAAVRFFYNNGTFTMSGGELVSGNFVALQAMGGSPVFNISGGHFKSNAEKEERKCSIDNYQCVNLTVNISGGQFDDRINLENATISVTGGKFGSTFNVEADDVNFISGGYFTVKPEQELIVSGKCAINNDGTEVSKIDYPWTIGNAVAKVVSTGEIFGDVQSAFDAAGEDDVVELLTDVVLDKGLTVTSTQRFTFDLKGNTLSGIMGGSGATALITNKGTLTLSDSSTGGTGLITNQATNPDTGAIPGYGSYVVDNQGTLTVESGKYVNATPSGYAAYVVNNAGTLTVNGGELDGGYTDAIRLCSFSGTVANVSATINGGIITSSKESGRVIWIHYPGKSVPAYTLTIQGGVIDGNIEAESYANYVPSEPLLLTTAQSESLTVSILPGADIRGEINIFNKEDYTGDSNITVTGGKIIGAITSNTKNFISGGFFGVKPEQEKIVTGKTAIGNDGTVVTDTATYPWTIGDLVSPVEITVDDDIDIDDPDIEEVINNIKENSNVDEDSSNIQEVVVETDKDSQLKIQLKALEIETVTQQASAITTKSAKYDVQPIFIFTDEKGIKTEKKITNTELVTLLNGQEVIFRLAVPDTMVDESRKIWVSHFATVNENPYTVSDKADWVGLYDIDGTEGGFYVELRTNQFCAYELSSASELEYVCQIGNTKYVSLELAVAAVPANTKTTITMIANHTIPEGTDCGVRIPSDRDIVLDLAGFEISGISETVKSYSLIDNRGTLTITDSSAVLTDGVEVITVTGKDGVRPSAENKQGTGRIVYYTEEADQQFHKGNYTVNNLGTLTVNAGCIENNPTIAGASYAVNTGGSGANCTINGGMFLVPNGDAVIRQFCVSTTGSNVLTINGGYFKGGMYDAVIWQQNPNGGGGTHGNAKVLGDLVINGGTFICGDGEAHPEVTDIVPIRAAIDVGGVGANNSGMTFTVNSGSFYGDIYVRELVKNDEATDVLVLKGGVYSVNVDTDNESLNRYVVEGKKVDDNEFDRESFIFDLDPMVYTVMVQTRIKGTSTSIGNATGGGNITFGSSTKVTTNNVSGYQFLGWYIGDTKIGSGLSMEYTPEGKEEEITLTAMYQAVSGELHTLEIQGDRFTLNGARQGQHYLQKLPGDVEYTINYTGNENFKYWVNSNEKIVSREKSYSFYLTSDMHYIAVTSDDTASSEAYVVFLTAFDQILSAQYYTSEDSIMFPATTSKAGSTFIGWTMSEEDIKAEMESSNVIIVEPLFESDGITYTYTIKYVGAGHENYVSAPLEIGQSQIYKAPAIVGNKVFQCWKDEAGNIISYRNELKVCASKDIVLRAFYGDNVIAQTGAAAMLDTQKALNGAKNVLRFYMSYGVPEGTTVTETGFLYTADSSVAKDSGFRLGKSGVTKLPSQNTNPIDTLTQTLNISDPDKVHYVRGFVTYMAGDISYTVYTGIYGGSYNSGAGSIWNSPVDDEHSTTTPVTGELTTVSTNKELYNVTAQVPSGALAEGAGSITLTVDNAEVPKNVITPSGKKSVAYDIDVAGVSEDNTVPVIVSVYIGKNIGSVSIYHENELIPDENVTYDSVTGMVSFPTTSFSVFTFQYKYDLSGLNNYKDAFRKENGALEPYYLTGPTTYTYKYRDDTQKDENGKSAVIVGDTVTEDNTLTYWMHLPYDYTPDKTYPVVYFFPGSGGVLYRQDNGCGGTKMKSADLFGDATEVALQRYTDQEYIWYVDGPVVAANNERYPVSTWFDYLKEDPAYDCIFITISPSDELWWEDLSDNGSTYQHLDIVDSCKTEYGGRITEVDPSHNYTPHCTYRQIYDASVLGPNVWFQLMQQLDEKLVKEYHADPDNISITGFSLGGIAVFDLLSQYPGHYAAAIACCSAACDPSFENTSRLGNEKLIAYSTRSDGYVDIANSYVFVDAINENRPAGDKGYATMWESSTGGHNNEFPFRKGENFERSWKFLTTQVDVAAQ